MAKKRVSASKRTKPAALQQQRQQQLYRCSLRPEPPRAFAPNVGRDRLRLILVNDKKWVNGTKLHYYFFEEPRAWVGKPAELDVDWKAFKMWKDLGIGLDFSEVASPSEAEVRIGFLRDDGAWSYVGRDVLGFQTGERTMNFGWDISADVDTAVHEIGHTIGLPHEHQNPYAGIVWDEPAVYHALAQPPNMWDRETTYHNIIRKISPDTVQGSSWDPDSVMHYPFEAGLIQEPAQYRAGLQPAGGLSARDKEWVQKFYPALGKTDYAKLEVAKSVALTLKPGEQKNFIFEPTATRHYDIRTFGTADTVMVVFEREANQERYLAGDDDSGQDLNASLRIKLFKGRTYVLRIRLYWSGAADQTAVMIW